MKAHNRLCLKLICHDFPYLLQRDKESVRYQEFFEMGDWNFFTSLEGKAETRLRLFLEQLSTTDPFWGERIYVNLVEVTEKFFQEFFSKVCAVKMDSVPSFIFVGEVSGGNKLGDIKAQVKQMPLTNSSLLNAIIEKVAPH